MNIALINFSVSVGKITLAFYFLKPRIENVLLRGVETINYFINFYDIKVTNKNFSKIQEEKSNIVTLIGLSRLYDTVKYGFSNSFKLLFK